MPNNFFETSYSTLAKAKSGNRESIDKIVEAYYPYILAIVARHLRFHRQEVPDVAQGFIASRLVGGSILRNYKSANGYSFRSYLAQCVANYCNSFLGSHIVRNQKTIDLGDDCENGGNQEQLNDDELYWARSILAAAVRSVKEECIQRGQNHIWEAFYEQSLAPGFLGLPPKPNEYFGITQQELSNRQVTSYRKLRRHLRNLLKELNGEVRFDEFADSITELMRRPFHVEPLVNELLSKRFHDDEVSRVFWSNGLSNEVMFLYPSSGLGKEVHQQLWIKTLSAKLSALDGSSAIDSPSRVDDILFTAVDSLLVRQVRLVAKKHIDSSASNEERQNYFILYTLAICCEVANLGVRTSSLNMLQIRHNIQK